MYYYKQVIDGKVVSVEAKSHKAISPGFTKTTKAIYDEFIASLPEPEPTPEPTKFERLNPAMGVEPRLTHIEDWLEAQ